MLSDTVGPIGPDQNSISNDYTHTLSRTFDADRPHNPHRKACAESVSRSSPPVTHTSSNPDNKTTAEPQTKYVSRYIDSGSENLSAPP